MLLSTRFYTSRENRVEHRESKETAVNLHLNGTVRNMGALVDKQLKNFDDNTCIKP